jgi:RNA polymerase sigma factor (sigma-70 family)
VADEIKTTAGRLLLTATEEFTEYNPALHRLLLRKLRNEDYAAGLMREIFLRYVAIDRATLIEDPKRYLFGIAFTVLSELTRYAGRNPAKFEPSVVEDCFEPFAEDAAEAAARRRNLMRQLRGLPQAWRDVLVLRMERGLSYKEIAREKGIAPETVSKYLKRTKALLLRNGA